MNRRDILLGAAAAASVSILPKAVAATPEPIRVMTQAEHMAFRPDMYARPIYLAVRSGEEQTKAAWVERNRRFSDRPGMAHAIARVEQAPEARLHFVDCGQMTPARAAQRLLDVKMQVEAGIPFEIASLPPKLSSGASAW